MLLLLHVCNIHHITSTTSFCFYVNDTNDIQFRIIHILSSISAIALAITLCYRSKAAGSRLENF